MASIDFHPAPGLGELLPGFFIVPQNPIEPDFTELVPTPQAMSGGRPVYIAHAGELMPASFPVPQNPLVKELSGLGVLGCGGCGAGCGCAGAHPMSGLAGLEGLGAFSLSDITSNVQQNWVTYAVIGGAALLLFMGGKEVSRRRRVSRIHKRLDDVTQ